MLLAISLQIGAAACLVHDLADMGLGGASGHASSTTMNGDVFESHESGEAPADAGNVVDCDHSNHHALAILPTFKHSLLAIPTQPISAVPVVAHAEAFRLQLRPPIV
ncbi:MAG: hypothetical protein WBP11_14675 [Dokdonella sp.]